MGPVHLRFFHVRFGMSSGDGAFAEFERAMIRGRVKAGLERARARGVQLGRPRITMKVAAAIRTRLAKGEGIKKVAKATGVDNGTVSRVKASMQNAVRDRLANAQWSTLRREVNASTPMVAVLTALQ